MPLATGTRLGPYEVTAQIGVGGMGEVYQATDTKLKRQVAIKVLPESVAADSDRLARFQREAEVLASLNHPHIAQIHGLEDADGVKALVMELVEGPTLADRIAQGAIPVDEAIAIAKQIAEALEEAHEHGIIHRDLKPANVKVREDGTVKVLDFGLAKALEPAGAGSPDVSHSPTMSAQATQAGVILGTAAYMSPEQARGKPVDKRADLWSFGVVLFEMLTGKRAFEGEDVSVTLADVIRAEPAWDALPEGLSPSLVTFLKRCLHKDPKERIPDIAAMRLALAGAFETHAAAAVAVAQPVWRQPLPVAAAALVLGGLLVGVAAWSLWPTAEVPRVTRTAITQPAVQPLSLSVRSPVLALSPDGTHAVYRVLVEGQPTLVVRPLDALEATVLYESNASVPFFSPDGAWVGFYDTDDTTIKRVAVTGGPALTISEVGAGRMTGATWGEDGTIIFGIVTSSGLWQVPAGGGTPEPLTTLDESQNESSHQWPELLPGGEAVLFPIRRAGEDADAAQIAVRHLGTGERRVLVSGGSYPKYVPTGHLVYAFAGTLRAVPFDLDQLTVTGNPVGVLEGVFTKVSGAADVAVAQDGSLVYATGVESGVVPSNLALVDRNGQIERLTAPPATYRSPRLSPDGSRLAVGTQGEDQSDIWVYDLSGDTQIRQLTQGGQNFSPIWTRDGERVTFVSDRDGGTDIYWQSADGRGVAERLTTAGAEERPNPMSWSPDGRVLAFARSPGADAAIWTLSLDGGSEPELFYDIPDGSDQRGAAFSPNGKWLAYHSDRAGEQDGQIYVQPFPPTGEIHQITQQGGVYPLWSPDGTELFYRRPVLNVANTAQMVGVDVITEAPFAVGPERELPIKDFAVTDARSRGYDITSDGQRFLMLFPGDQGDSDEPVQPQIILVQNWHQELLERVPIP